MPISTVARESSQSLVRILKSGLLGQNDFQELLEKMEANEKLVDRCASLVQGESRYYIHLLSFELRS